MGALRGFDPVTAAADRREVEVVGRVDRELVSADRPPEDDAQRIENVRDGRGGQALLAKVVDEVLDVAALDLRQLPAAEGRDDVRRGVAARNRAQSKACTACRRDRGSCRRARRRSGPRRPRQSSSPSAVAWFRGAARPARPGATASPRSAWGRCATPGDLSGRRTPAPDRWGCSCTRRRRATCNCGRGECGSR